MPAGEGRAPRELVMSRFLLSEGAPRWEVVTDPRTEATCRRNPGVWEVRRFVEADPAPAVPDGGHGAREREAMTALAQLAKNCIDADDSLDVLADIADCIEDGNYAGAALQAEKVDHDGGERLAEALRAPAPDGGQTDREAWVSAADLVVGDVVEHGPYKGAIVRITEHGRAIGDGSVDWRTFQVARASALGGLAPSSTMGPLRATEAVSLLVRAPSAPSAPVEGDGDA